MGRKLNYAGIGGAVAGIVALLGIYSDWWSSDTTLYYGVADISGRLALAMAIGLFAFGVAYVLMSDPAIDAEKRARSRNAYSAMNSSAVGRGG